MNNHLNKWVRVLFLFFVCIQTSLVYSQNVHVAYDDTFELIENSKFVGEDSLVSIYYPNGSLKSTGKLALYPDGKLSPFKIGEWIKYYQNGTIESKGNYEMSSLIDCGPGGLQRQFYNYKTANWLFNFSNGKLKASGFFIMEKLPISTRCDSEIIVFGITDSSWVFRNEEGQEISPTFELLNSIEKVETQDEYYLSFILYDRNSGWLKTVYEFE